MHGGDLDENDNSKKGQLVMHSCKVLYGGDLNETVNFNEGKLVMDGYIILHGAISTKMNFSWKGN